MPSSGGAALPHSAPSSDEYARLFGYGLTEEVCSTLLDLVDRLAKGTFGEATGALGLSRLRMPL